MTRDIEVLRAWLLIVVVIAAIGATAVPIIYSLLPWRKHRIGAAFMVQAISFAVALDMTVLFAFWTPEDILVLFWVEAMMFTAIAASTTTLAWITIRLRYPSRRTFKLLFNKGVYEFLKKLVQIILPAFASLYFGLAQIWGLPHAENVVGTTALVATFLGICLGLSTREYNNTELKFDGDVLIESNEEGTGSTLRLNNVSRDALESKNEILLKVNRTD
jgi:hypothetical protein